MTAEICPGCGLRTPQSDGPVHNYLKSSPGCWAKYGELLAREYENVAYWAAHEITVDAYALQHPGQEGPQTRRSAYVHLASLFSYFELGKPMAELHAVKQKAAAIAKREAALPWLTPPDALTELTVESVLAAETAAQHCQRVEAWARYVFAGWQDHHKEISRILVS